MTFWLGKSSQYSLNGLPHTTKIIRNPRGVGTEFKLYVVPNQVYF